MTDNKRLESKRKWKAENREKIREYEREYRKKNKDKIKEQVAKRREVNKDFLKKHEKEYRREYYAKNREKILEQQKEYTSKNIEAQQKYSKDYYSKNSERLKKYQFDNREKFSERISQYRKEYYKNNREKILKNTSEYAKRNSHKTNERARLRKEVDPLYKLKHNLLSSNHRIFKVMGQKKNVKTITLLGADYETVMNHIESQFTKDMNWSNYGRGGWHIDHIIPLGSVSTAEEMYELCHYTNLQPLWEIDNLSKGDRIISYSLETREPIYD